jgi:signal peptidase II
MINTKTLASITAILTIILDYISKYYTLELFKDNEHMVLKITSFFNIVLAWNKGITFGLFNKSSFGPIVFIVIAGAIACCLYVWMLRSNKKSEIYALSFIIGGAIGNIIDRIKYGAVVDFLDFYIKDYHWHTFNLADSFICIGVTILLFENIMNNAKKQ